MTDDNAIIRVRGASVAFHREGERFGALEDVSLDVSAGELVGVAGPSGSGKTTLLNVVAGLLRPRAGSVAIDGMDLYEQTDRARTRLRNEKIGFIFQTYHLHPMLDVGQNVGLPLAFSARPAEEARYAVSAILERLGLDDLARVKAGALSAGQKQRVLAARALVGGPAIVLADEPTANLDQENARVVLDALWQEQELRGTTVLLVAHNPRALEGVARTLHLDSGRLAP